MAEKETQKKGPLQRRNSTSNIGESESSRIKPPFNPCIHCAKPIIRRESDQSLLQLEIGEWKLDKSRIDHDVPKRKRFSKGAADFEVARDFAGKEGTAHFHEAIAAHAQIE